MTMQGQPMFEAPASYESNPYSNSEFENEWELPESNPYSNPEFENEWEMHEAINYSNAFSNPELQNEWEMPESNPYSNPEFENEWEMHEAINYSNAFSNPEFEEEGEYFFKGIGKAFKSIAKKALPLARKLAPGVVKSLVSMVPGVGAIAAPLAGKLTTAMLQEGEMEAAQLEAEFFGSNEFEAEISNSEVAHEAALTEFLASQAAEATLEAEAEAAIGATLPITIKIMGGQQALRPMLGTMLRAHGRRTKLLSQQGRVGQQLLRAVPAMDRIAVSTLKSAARAGQPINSATAVKAMAAATKQVMSNPQKLQKALAQNLSVRQNTVAPSSARQPYNPRRAAAHQCPTCAGRGR